MEGHGNYDVGKFHSRHDWDALPPKRLKELKTPVNRVVTTWADVDPCFTTEECMQTIRDLQKEHLERNLDDIEHNFMIGGDGSIYEGRGWYNVGPTYPEELKYADELSGRSVQIAVLDKFDTKPSKISLKGTTDCVAYGLTGRYLQEKVLFFWKYKDTIQYISSYETNAPGASHTENFTNTNTSRYEADRDRERTLANEKTVDGEAKDGNEQNIDIPPVVD